MSNKAKFRALVGKSHYAIADEMADEIKAAIYKHSDKIPLALAMGVIRIVEQEILDNFRQ
jgi:hypothetical protein